MKVFNVAPVVLLSRVVAAAALAQQSSFRLPGKPVLAAVQQSHASNTIVASGQLHARQDRMNGGRSSTPYDTTHYMDTRGMTPWTYGTEMWPSWRDSDGIREPGEHGPHQYAKHDRSLGRRGPRAWPYMDEIISHFPDKIWVLLGFLTGLFCCLPCICSTQGDDQQESFNMGLVGLSISGVLIVSAIVFNKLGWLEVGWRIHIMIWGYYWWIGLLLIPCTCMGVIGFLIFVTPAVCLRLYRIIFPPLSKDGGYGMDADAITEKALGPKMKHFEQRYAGASWTDLLPHGSDFLMNEPQPRPNAGSDNVPHLPILPREPGDWEQYAAWNGSLSGT